jgi:hypothetical protein
MEFKTEPVMVSRAAFAFCRYSLMLMLWAAFFLRLKILVVAAVVILALSALLTVRRAPLIALYTHTVGRLWPSRLEELDLYGMQFAHILGSIVGLACVLFLYVFHERMGWALTFVFCLLKTVSAAGLCPASRLYNCMAGGKCCAFLKGKE